MTKVRQTFEGVGATGVATYIQSGNVVFAHAEKTASKLVASLGTSLTKTAGFTVPVVLRTKAEWTAAITASPYRPDDLHCAFLPAVATEAQLAKLDALDREAFLPSRFEVIGRHVYLDLPDGIGRDKLAGSVLRVFADATVRNWRTVTKLAEMLATT